jgi:Domain of unknown function (DUF4118)
MMGSVLLKSGAGYIAALLGSAAVTAICAPFHDKLDHTTVTMALLLVVLLVARVWGAWPGRFASLVGAPPGTSTGIRLYAQVARKHFGVSEEESG